MPRVLHGKRVKYETPSGSRMALDVHPSVRNLLGDPSIPLFVTEGVKKGDSLVSNGCCAVALLGVWNWRGKNGRCGKAVPADFESIALNGRQVYIAFDSDVMTKPEVHAALERLSEFLKSREGRVSFIYLPAGKHGEKVGVDELLGLASAKLRRPPPSDRELVYETTPSGLVWNKETRDGRQPVPLTDFTAEIVSDITEDDGAESTRALELVAELDGRKITFTLPAAQFSSMNWPLEHLGAKVIVEPGFALRDRTRAAIQSISTKIDERTVYGHTGWREISNRWYYLHQNGAIGPDGTATSDVETRLDGNSASFALPPLPSAENARTGVVESLNLLGLSRDEVTIPLVTGTFAAALSGTDFTLALFDTTGRGKSELAARCQQHFGSARTRLNLPGSWSSTENALEELAFVTKDALLVVDDFSPQSARSHLDRAQRTAERLLRGQGNRSPRQRMRRDDTLRPPRPPRGLLLMTAEDVPRGESIRARTLVIELDEDVDWETMTLAQDAGDNGRFADAMAAFIAWVAPQYEQIQEQYKAETRAIQSRLRASPEQHRRLPEIIAKLLAAFRLFLQFATAVGSIDDAKRLELDDRAQTTFAAAAERQHHNQDAADPVGRYLATLSSAAASGDAHLASIHGEEPEDPEVWGWRPISSGNGEYEQHRHIPQGRCVGWVDGDCIYLDPEASYAAAQKLGEANSDPIGVTPRTLGRRLKEQGRLLETDEDRGRVAVRKMIGSRRLPVWVLRQDTLSKPSQPSRPSLAPASDPHQDASLGDWVEV